VDAIYKPKIADPRTWIVPLSHSEKISVDSKAKDAWPAESTYGSQKLESKPNYTELTLGIRLRLILVSF
jgi:hypothetical protein